MTVVGGWVLWFNGLPDVGDLGDRLGSAFGLLTLAVFAMATARFW